MDTLVCMEYHVEQTEVFARWRSGLKNVRARVAIARRIERAAAGNMGDTKSVGGGVSEMRVDIGPGYRIYFTTRRGIVIILLCGGDKRRQPSDIEKARRMASEIK